MIALGLLFAVGFLLASAADVLDSTMRQPDALGLAVGMGLIVAICGAAYSVWSVIP